MTKAAQDFLRSFKALPPTDQHDVLVQLLREPIEATYEAPSDDELVDAADGDIQRLEKALAGGAKVDERGPNDETALMLAARNGRTKAVEFLLAKGADRTVATPKGSTAAALAASFNHDHIVNLLSK